MPSDAALETCQQHIGYRFCNVDLLRSALRHASSANRRLESNERLEFLGDAVLGLIICETLYRLLPDALEGDMTKIKSSVVSRRTCAAVARALNLTDGLVLGQGMDEESLPSSLAAGTLEAVIGAIYLDGGLEAARAFVLRHMDHEMQRAIRSKHQFNFKSQLQQYAQREFNATPVYELLDEKGPDHAKCFEVAVSIGSRQFPSAWGPNKKEAEQKAARLALLALGQISEPLTEDALP